MGVKVTNTIDFKAMKELAMKELGDTLEKAVADETDEIVKRTQSGQSVNGGGFAPYTPAYKKFKAKKGRSGKVDLTFTGKMLAAIDYKIQKISNGFRATVFFNSAEAAAKAEGNSKKRQFFGFSKEQVDRITKKLQDTFKK